MKAVPFIQQRTLGTFEDDRNRWLEVAIRLAAVRRFNLMWLSTPNTDYSQLVARLAWPG